MPTSALWKRLASAVVLIPLFVWLMTGAPRALFEVLVVAVSAWAMRELERMFEHAGRPTLGWLGVAAAAVTTASFLVPGGPMAVLTLAVVLALSAPLFTDRPLSTEPVVTTLFGLVYVSWLLGHGLLLRAVPNGAHLVLFLVGVTWAGESLAYAVGSTLGRHRLAPVVSPRKTVEGAAAHALASLAAAALLSAWLVPGWPLLTALSAGLLLGIVGQVGDLAESAIKRSLGVKDTGGLIPGHGGLLDRLDSLLFNAPALYYFVWLHGGRT